LNYLRFVFSHSWFATVQDVLQADWHEVWHSPQPLLVVFFKVGFAIVLMFFMYVVLLISRLIGHQSISNSFARILWNLHYRLLKKGRNVNTFDCLV